jgi:peptidyl-tRNA hydrolase, PTH2 family
MAFIKQVIVWRHDLKVRKGKIAVQCAHASLACILDMMPESRWLDDDNNPMPVTRTLRYEQESALDQWFSKKFAKIVVYVNNEQELLEIYNKAKESALPASLIQDVGDTEFHGIPTYTTVGIGPAESEKIDKITGHLKLL